MGEGKYELHHMTWKEIEKAFSKDPVILVPMGSMEEHGPHSITGDYLAAYEITKRVAKKSNSYCIPVIPFGHSEYFRGFPGTISLSADTVFSLFSDVCESLTEHGITKIIFINGHAGNAAILDRLARKVKREKRLMIGKIDLWQSLTLDFKRELYGEDFNPSGHGGEPLTSVMKYLYPEDMRMDLLKNSVNSKVWEGFEISHISKARIKDTQISLYFDMEDISEQGVMGNPYIGTGEIGEKIINKLVEYGVEFVEKMKKANTCIR